MTKQEAIELEERCDKLMSEYLDQDCCVSLALTGRLKVLFGDGDYITLSKDNKSASYINFQGYYSDLEDYIDEIVRCIDENVDVFYRLIWSYENLTELEE